MVNRVAAWRRRWVVGGGLAIAAAAGIWFATQTTQRKKRAPPAPTVAPPAKVRLTGSQVLHNYAKLDASDEHARHRLVLEQIAERNMPDSWDDWATVTVEGRKGTVVQFEASPHGLRIGTNQDWVEIPLDGPHSAAAAEILATEIPGMRIATAWMVDQIYEAARSKGRPVPYFAAVQIAKSLGYTNWNPDVPDGVKMKSAEFFERKSKLIRDWYEEHNVDQSLLTGGYFKAVVPPIDGVTRSGGLEMLGGHTATGERVQPLSGGFHGSVFFDYSQNVRFVKDPLVVNGQPMSMDEFWDNVPYALEFGFRRSSIPNPAYPYPDDLAAWMRTQGHSKGP